MTKPIPELTERQDRNLWPKIDKRGPDDCWPWLASSLPSGYGKLNLGGSSYLAHRIVYKLAKGEPGDLHVCHSCDNPKCCNPNHLWLGTAADNQRDSGEKGRANRHSPCGEKNGQSTLTLAQVIEIKTRLKNPYLGLNKVLAKEYDVSRALISNIKTGYCWSHVTV